MTYHVTEVEHPEDTGLQLLAIHAIDAVPNESLLLNKETYWTGQSRHHLLWTKFPQGPDCYDIVTRNRAQFWSGSELFHWR